MKGSRFHSSWIKVQVNHVHVDPDYSCNSYIGMRFPLQWREVKEAVSWRLQCR